MADAPNQKVLLVGFAAAFVAVALVIFLMLRGGTDEASQAPPSSAPPSGQRPQYKAPPNMPPNQMHRAIDVNPPSTEKAPDPVAPSLPPPH